MRPDQGRGGVTKDVAPGVHQSSIAPCGCSEHVGLDGYDLGEETTTENEVGDTIRDVFLHSLSRYSASGLHPMVTRL